MPRPISVPSFFINLAVVSGFLDVMCAFCIAALYNAPTIARRASRDAARSVSERVGDASLFGRKVNGLARRVLP